MVGAPVIINHKNLNNKNVDDERVGVVNSVWYDNKDGWYWCDGIIWDETAQNLITDKNWSVSCSYDVKTADNKGGSENNIKYDMEFLDGVFTHLALVNNPRYERANIVFNSKTVVENSITNEKNNDKWITKYDKEGEPYHVNIDDTDDKEEKQSDKEDKNKYLKKGDLETDKVYKLGNLYVKPFVDDDGDLAFYDRTGAWGEGSVAQKFLKSDLKNLERAEKYDKLTDKELKFLSEKGDFEKGTKSTKKDEDRHQKVRDLEDKAYKEFKTMYDNYIDKDGMEGWGGIPASRFDKAKEQFNKKYKDAFDKLESDRFVSFEDFAKRENKQSDSKAEKKYNYTLTKREVEDRKMFGGMADTGNYYTNGDFAIDKKYLNIKGQEPTKKEEIEKSLKHILKGDSTDRYTPVKDFEIGELKREYGKPIKVAKYSYYDEKNGFERHIYLNKKYNDLFKNFDLKFGGETEPVFAYKGKDIVGVVMPINAREQSYSKTVNNEIEEELTEDKNQLKLKIDNSKEQDMALIEELKKLITKVENTKGEKDMEIENEKVDKRDIIRQIMAIAGKEEASEDVKTIAKLAEKLAYDKSEAGTADNKCKNEDDEKEVEKVKEDVKEDIENKCKNSVDNSKVDYFSKLNEIYNAASQVKEETEYVSQADREKAAEDYFAK